MIRQRPAPSAMRTEISRDRPMRAGEQQIRKIGAGDQEHKTDGAPHGSVEHDRVRANEELMEILDRVEQSPDW